MNLNWAKEWLSEFGAPQRIRARYADRVDFEDVTLGHKESTGDGVRDFFASFTKAAASTRSSYAAIWADRRAAPSNGRGMPGTPVS
jgi:hypothetical protein